MICKVSRWCKNMDDMKSVLMTRVIWKVYGWFKNSPHDLKSVQMIRKISRWPASIRVIWKVSTWSEKWLDDPKSVLMNMIPGFEKRLDDPKSVQITCKVSLCSEKYVCDLKSDRIIRKASGWYEKCLDDPSDLKSAQMIQKVSVWCEKYREERKSDQMIRKVSGWYEKWIDNPGNMKSFLVCK